MTQLLRREGQHDAETIELTVRRLETIADDCIVLILEKSDHGELPEWAPGAHIDLILGEGLVRQYSLCGDPADTSAWRLGIIRDPHSRGGSAFLHDRVRLGSTILARGPRNHFELEPAPRYLFVAGGIGITPILPMLRSAEAARADWRLLYGGRCHSSMAFLEELREYGEHVQIRPQDQYGLLDLRGFLAGADIGTAVYGCGPEPLLAALEQACAAESLPLHLERFAPKPMTNPDPNHSFEVVCAESGITVEVGADSTILAEVRKAGIEVLSSCSEGTCGTCETDVLEGVPEHRDSVLTPEERKTGESMMICVSRCVGKRLVLEL